LLFTETCVMSRAYSDIAFTHNVRAVQTDMGSRANYAPLDLTDDRRDALGQPEAEFIRDRDGFYQATVSETGWPYVQFRGGPAGFLKVLDAKTIGYADFRGNVQYISVGNLLGNDRVSIILMDYANQRRLKILGRVRLINESEDPALIARLELPHYRARVERAVLISVEAYDWNCPQHITPRFTQAEVQDSVAPLHAEIANLKLALTTAAAPSNPAVLGKGPLALRISGVRQLTPRVRAYELSAPEGSDLPPVAAGSHIDVPVRLSSGVVSQRRYSIAANPSRRDAYEIAVLREDMGSGGSMAVHASFRLGQVLNCNAPGNDFMLHGDARPTVLIAGGIGITPIRAMAYQLHTSARGFELHYAARSRSQAAYLHGLEEAFAAELQFYAGDQGQRLDVAKVLTRSGNDTVFYVCGPAPLIDAVRSEAAAAGIAADRIRFERFLPAASAAANAPLSVILRRRGKRVEVAADQSVLEAIEAAGVAAASGCRNGSCGTCRVKVLNGQPLHRDLALNDTERDQAGLMCICVSRAQGTELTLDM
jgi:ferredoxin-NADP reductase/predicted pyridoxine 5'-phosphate oxidase superfamily flavin-nucleotide-binding protein